MNKIEYVKSNFKDFFSDVFHDRGLGGEGCVQHPNRLYNGRRTACRSTMHTLVRMLKPTYILEIGSWKYDCSNIMSDALDEINAPDDARIDTFDIMDGGYSKSAYSLKNRVKPYFWLPHHTDWDKFKYVANVVYPEFRTMNNEEIWNRNLEILKGVSPTNGYDLIFLDGDHSLDGNKYDFKYAQEVAHQNTIFVIDDLYEVRNQPCRDFFDSLPYNKYDWEDWNSDKNKPLVGMGIFQC